MRMGIIGGGKIGALRAASVKNADEHELVAVLDMSLDIAKAAAAGTNAITTTDLTEFLKTEPDLVFISTPPHTHREFAEASFDAGAHVLCEKPLAHTVEDGRAMVAAAKQAGRHLATGFNMRYYPFVKIVREAVDRGMIGNITHVRAFGGHDGLHNFSADWQYKMPLSGGGAMMDVGIHISDLVRYFLGDITQVSGVMSESVWNLEGSEDNSVAVFRNAQGIPALYQATWHEWKGYQNWIEVYGDRGMARGSYAPMRAMVISRDRNGRQSKKSHLFPEIMVREKLKTWQSTALLSFEDELRDVVRLITEGDIGEAADGHDGLSSLEVAQAVRQSTETGETVRLDPLGRME